MERIFKKSSKILLAVDKFKGSLTSLEAESAIEEGILDSAGMEGSFFGGVPEIVKVPMADGGDGSLEAVSAVWGPSCRRIRCRVTGPLGVPVETEFLVSGERAFIEMAKVCGLVMVPEHERNPLNTTTYGLGETMLEAYGAGARHIFVSIGGSATNDCGAGMMQALGYGFLDSEGDILDTPVFGRDLAGIKRVLPAGNILAGSTVTVICDVTNPLLGENGATMVYGRQKGADNALLAQLERGVENFSAAAAALPGFRNADPDFPGAGAAGGTGFALKYFAGATLLKGEQFFMELTGIEAMVADADLVVGGEGSIDSQSFYGKLVSWLYALCRKHNKPLVLFCGVDKSGFSAPDCRIFALYDIEKDISRCISRAFPLLRKRACMAFSDEMNELKKNRIIS